MIIKGKLTADNQIIVENANDVGRLYNKSYFGKILSGNLLQLNLIESLFLLEECKIKIKSENKILSFQDLSLIAANNISDFEIKYLVFKDLRNRGYFVKFYEESKDVTFYIKNNQKELYENRILVLTFSERDLFHISEIIKLFEKFKISKDKIWLSIVDEEGDITYYSVSIIDLNGINKKSSYVKTKSYFFKDRVVIFDKDSSKKLFKEEFYGKFFGEGLQLSLVESLFLLKQNIIEVYDQDNKKISKSSFEKRVKEIQPDIGLRLVIFDDLKNRGLIVKTGFKFGTHFRVYSKKPDQTHAEFLVHVVEKNYKSIWAEISRAVRLAHSVNKELIFAKIDEKIEYVKFSRLRP